MSTGRLGLAALVALFHAAAAYPAPRIAVAPPFLVFGAREGGPNPEGQILTISNAGDGTLNWTATPDTFGGNWLSVEPSSGTNSGRIVVSVNVAGLRAGHYHAQVQVTAPGATNNPQLPQILVDISPSVPAVALNSTSLVFTTAQPGSNAASQTLQVYNSGGGTLGWTATVATRSGGSWLAVSPLTGVAPSQLTVSVSPGSLAVGVYNGTITITPTPGSNASNGPQAVAVTLAVGVPVINRGGIVNAASFARDAIVSSGSLVSLFGSNLAQGTEVAAAQPLPRTLAGTQVLVNDVAAPLFFVSPTQINFQMPVEALGVQVPVIVVAGGVRGLTEAAFVAPVAPGIFSATPGGTGQGAVLNQDFTLNSAQNPAHPGSVIQIFATGLGATNPPISTGQPGSSAPPFNSTAQTPAVLINGVSAEVLFSAVAPGFVGLYQVNAKVPANTPAGDAVALQIGANTQLSNTVSIAVR